MNSRLVYLFLNKYMIQIFVNRIKKQKNQEKTKQQKSKNIISKTHLPSSLEKKESEFFKSILNLFLFFLLRYQISPVKNRNYDYR